MATVSSLDSQEGGLHSHEGRELLDLIDNLRRLPTIKHEIALPQIVVVGQQSSGKSSVLKAISKIDFPTNSGLCTQFATEIICRREADKRTKAQIVPAATVDLKYRHKLDEFSQRWANISENQDISEIIQNAKQVMGLDGHRCISKDKLRLEFCGPHQDHISLIDLPGLFEQSLPGQREDDKMLVDEMVGEYISGSQTIVLAVVSGAYDLQVQRIFSMFEPYQARTLGIITAPDKVESGTARAATFKQLVANQSFKAGYGWYIIRNLSHNEEKDGKDRDEVEDRFIASRTQNPNEVWSNVPDEQLGIKNLKHRLATLLQDNIVQGLPQIQRQLRLALEKSENQLELLGQERVTADQQRDYLVVKSETLKRLTRRELEGGHSKHSLRSKIRTANDSFADNMQKSGATWLFVDKKPNPSTYVPGQEFDVPIVLTGREWVDMMLGEISYNRGRELDGLLNPIWVGRMFLKQNAKWRRIAEAHVQESFTLVEHYLGEIVNEIVGANSAHRFMEHAIRPELERRNKALKEKLVELLEPYSTEHIRTLNKFCQVQQPEPATELFNTEKESFSMENTIAHYSQVMTRFYNHALLVFVDNVESLAVENVLLAGIENIMTAKPVHRMTEAELAALASESEEVTEKRQKLKARIVEYEEGSKMTSRYVIRHQYGARMDGQQLNKFQNDVAIPPAVADVVVTVSEPAVSQASATKNVPSGSGDDTVVAGASSGRFGQRLSSAVSSRCSSVAPRVFTDDEESLPSKTSSVNSTPSKFKVGRRNKFERTEGNEEVHGLSFGS